jgi:hypothetical protein
MCNGTDMVTVEMGRCCKLTSAELEVVSGGSLLTAIKNFFGKPDLDVVTGSTGEVCHTNPYWNSHV